MGESWASYSPLELFLDDYQLGSYALGGSLWFSRVKRTHLGREISLNQTQIYNELEYKISIKHRYIMN